MAVFLLFVLVHVQSISPKCDVSKGFAIRMFQSIDSDIEMRLRFGE